jgi:hypothetical protein
MTMKGLAMRSPAQRSAAFRFPAHSIAGRAGTSLKHEHAIPWGHRLAPGRSRTAKAPAVKMQAR